MADSSAFHENFSRHKKAKAGSDKSFCYAFSCLFALLGFYPLINGHPLRIWLLAVSGMFLFVAFIRPKIVSPFNRIWRKVGFFLGKITTPVMMWMIYFSLFVFMGTIFRLLRRDALRLKFDPLAKTYWIKENREVKLKSPF